MSDKRAFLLVLIHVWHKSLPACLSQDIYSVSWHKNLPAGLSQDIYIYTYYHLCVGQKCLPAGLSQDIYWQGGKRKAAKFLVDTSNRTFNKDWGDLLVWCSDAWCMLLLSVPDASAAWKYTKKTHCLVFTPDCFKLNRVKNICNFCIHFGNRISNLYFTRI